MFKIARVLLLLLLCGLSQSISAMSSAMQEEDANLLKENNNLEENNNLAEKLDKKRKNDTIIDPEQQNLNKKQKINTPTIGQETTVWQDTRVALYLPIKIPTATAKYLIALGKNTNDLFWGFTNNIAYQFFIWTSKQQVIIDNNENVHDECQLVICAIKNHKPVEFTNNKMIAGEILIEKVIEAFSGFYWTNKKTEEKTVIEYFVNTIKNANIADDLTIIFVFLNHEKHKNIIDTINEAFNTFRKKLITNPSFTTTELENRGANYKRLLEQDMDKEAIAYNTKTKEEMFSVLVELFATKNNKQPLWIKLLENKTE